MADQPALPETQTAPDAASTASAVGEKQIAWHPAFVAGIELMLWPYWDQITFAEEIALGQPPFKADMLVKKKDSSLNLTPQLFQHFLQHNLLEFKSVHDKLTIEDYFKIQAYPCFYISRGNEDGERIKGNTVTMTILRESKPQKMFADLVEIGAEIQEAGTGIYLIEGPAVVPTYLVVIRELPPGDNAALRSLKHKALFEDVRTFFSLSSDNVDETKQETMQSKMQTLVFAILKANPEYAHLVREDVIMDEEMRLILKDYFDEKWNDGYQQGMDQGIEIGRKESAEKMEKLSGEIAKLKQTLADVLQREGNSPTLQPT